MRKADAHRSASVLIVHALDTWLDQTGWSQIAPDIPSVLSYGLLTMRMCFAGLRGSMIRVGVETSQLRSGQLFRAL